MKKKYVASLKDKKDWINFTKQMGNITSKEADFSRQNIEANKVRKIDLHGFSLIEANKIVTKFIVESFNSGYKKILIVTGKGLRSKTYENPYISEKFGVLRHAIPEYIKNNNNLNNKIIRISEASVKDGGEGAIYIFLKNNKKFKE